MASNVDSITHLEVFISPMLLVSAAARPSSNCLVHSGNYESPDWDILGLCPQQLTDDFDHILIGPYTNSKSLNMSVKDFSTNSKWVTRSQVLVMLPFPTRYAFFILGLSDFEGVQHAPRNGYVTKPDCWLSILRLSFSHLQRERGSCWYKVIEIKKNMMLVCSMLVARTVYLHLSDYPICK